MPADTPARTPSIALMTLIAMASPLALNLFVPAMPDAVRDLGTEVGVIQLSFTAYLFTLAFGQLMSGPLADHFGRRPILLGGLVLHTAGSLLAALAPDVTLLIAGRVLQALGGSAAMVLARTIIIDIYGREGAASRMGYVVMAIAIAQTIAPTLGGYLNLWAGWHSIFYVSLGMGAVALLVAALQLPETCRDRSDSLRLGPVIQRYAGVFSSGGYLGYALSTTFIAAAFYIFMGTSPYIVDSLGGNSALFGTWFLAVSLAFMSGSFLSTRLARYASADQVMLLGNALSLTGALVLFGFALGGELSYGSLFLPMAVVTLGRGLSQPNAQSAAISCSPTSAATASGLMGFIQLLTGSVIAQLMPLLLGKGVLPIAACICLAPVAALGAHYYALTRQHRTKAEA
ncbi:MFS transporter, DHA1 family, bicyclomycin/chloramphenicol resistance protein [Marinobacter sp. es.048]|uniref:multidrug effflux MFS transporter n=1 Tax=Marinobacter sp. es.048 TaxID=1761795 RepID=UPI000B58BEFD|nr:multidrug effflux MFS transporter [Marinobacter sp. es.048]SNC67535.1 MFS transporter, DHA1 family, bicyclomycin/chloramphenicol resistance protein [Marinobacter sp. es.048]